MAAPIDRLDRSELAATIRTCTLCPLSQSRTHALPGTGPDHADVMVLLDAPGYLEDRADEPLVGPAGDLVGRMLARAGLTRDSVFVSWVARCHPPGSRGLTQDEVRTCEGYLYRELALVGPRVVVACGPTPARLLSGTGARMADLLGRPQQITAARRPALLLPLHDPRAAWQVEHLAERFVAAGDTLADLLAGMPQHRATVAPESPAPPAAPARQRDGADTQPEPAATPGSQMGLDLGGA